MRQLMTMAKTHLGDLEPTGLDHPEMVEKTIKGMLSGLRNRGIRTSMKIQLAQVKWNTLLAVLFFIHLFSSVTFGQGDKCIKVVDGDTIIITYQGMMEKVRLIGVDTPETVHPKKPVEYFAQEASAFTRSLVEGKDVTLEFDWQKRDKYRRLLAYVYLADGTMLNRRIIEAGYGHAYTKYPFKYLDEFRKAEKQAREEGKGLWAKFTQGTG